MDVRGGPWRRMSTKELMLSNCGGKKTLESPLDSKEIKSVNLKGNQHWIFLGRTDPEAEVPIHWPLDAKNWLIGKDPDAGKDWRQEEKGVTEDKMVGWNHWLNGHKFEQTRGGSEGRGGLACCSPCGCNKSVPLIRWPKCWSFSFSISPSNEYSGLISFRMDWLQSKGLSRIFSNTTVQKHQFFNSLVLSFLYSPTLTSIYDSCKNHSLD